jgi:hypothetical protein
MSTKRVLVLGSILLGCGSPDRPSPGGDKGGDKGDTTVPAVADAAVPGQHGGVGAGSGGHAGNAGAGGAGGMGTLPNRPDAGGSASDGALAMSSLDTAPAATGDTWAKCGPESFKPGISAADFCARYMTSCKFDPAGDGKESYKSLDDCVAKYNMLSDGPRGGKACVAYHLCVAGSPDTAATFCPHAPEASAMTGPCKAAYL